MSNTGGWGSAAPQGADWWQASDGLWYPPTGQQQVQTVAPPPVQPSVPQSFAPTFTGTAYALPAGAVHVSYDGPVEKVGRLRPFYVAFLAIPQFFGCLFACIVAAFSMYAAYFGILLMQRVHPRSHDKIVRAYRYQWRLMTFLLCWRNQAPGNVPAGGVDPGDDPARLSIAYGGEGLRRFGPIVKAFTTIPWQIVLFFKMIGAYFTILFGTFNVLFGGEFPQEKRNKVVAVWNEATQLSAYVLLTDVDPRKR
jgi:hypothetical protein